MAQKRKISVRKVIQAIVTLLVIAACIFAITSASSNAKKRVVADIDLDLGEGKNSRYLDRTSLWADLITANNIKKGQTKISDVDLEAIERRAYDHEWIGKAQAWIDNQDVLHVELTPGKPEARVFFDDGESAYIDQGLRFLPTSEMTAYYTTIVTNFPKKLNDSVSKNLRAQVLRLVKFIEQDTFWYAQVDQVSILPDRTFELVPVLGKQRIFIGDTSNLAQKFNRLFVFYKRVLNKVGWDKYQTIDVRFNDQVVASPSLAWKVPTKNATSNMDWLNSVMQQSGNDSIFAPENGFVNGVVRDVVPARGASSSGVTASVKPVKDKRDPVVVQSPSVRVMPDKRQVRDSRTGNASAGLRGQIKQDEHPKAKSAPDRAAKAPAKPERPDPKVAKPSVQGRATRTANHSNQTLTSTRNEKRTDKKPVRDKAKAPEPKGKYLYEKTSQKR